jgi:hypothetical protein
MNYMEQSRREELYHSLLDDDKLISWLLHPTDKTDKYWNHIMQEDPEKKEAINELRTITRGIKVVEEDLTEEAKKEVWQKIETSFHGKRKLFHLPYFFRYAAVLCLVAVGSLYFYTTQKNETEKGIDYQSFVAALPSIDQTPGNVTLILANQEKIEIEEASASLRLDADGRISVNTKVIESDKSTNKPETNLLQLVVPYGKTGNLELSDGSKIWINSGSRIIYPAVFADSKREIFIDGEAYLEVARNEKSPFIVKTDLMEISVLGTSFNISGYKNDDQQSVVLAEGSVSIKRIQDKTAQTIKPNQKYTLEKQTHHAVVNEVDIFDYICWKYGFLSFKNEKLSDVLKKVERYYNIRIGYDASAALDRTTVSGKLDLKEDIKETFRIISITAPITYEIQNEGIKINVKP